MNNSSTSLWITIRSIVLLTLLSCQQDKSVSNTSDVEVVFNYIMSHDYLPGQEKTIPFEITKQFQSFSGESANNNSAIIKHKLNSALALENEPGIRKLLNEDCLATSNTSTEINVLREKVFLLKKEIRQSSNKNNSVLLSFSSSCTTSDGSHYYYVELIVRSEHYASGDLYILNKGVVERVINIWIT